LRRANVVKKKLQEIIRRKIRHAGKASAIDLR
jgi:hypothetical protein